MTDTQKTFFNYQIDVMDNVDATLIGVLDRMHSTYYDVCKLYLESDLPSLSAYLIEHNIDLSTCASLCALVDNIEEEISNGK